MALGLKGFVRNLPDGSVELEAEGNENLLHKLLSWSRHGPPSARVDKIDVDWLEPANVEGEFTIRS